MTTKADPHTFPAIGTFLHFHDTMVAELAGEAGYDYLMLDMEHGVGSLKDMVPMLQAARAGGARGLVRAPSADPVWLGRLMDAGADGVMVPQVNTAAQAAAIATGARYAPEGRRGMAATIIRGSSYGLELPGYLATYRQQFLLIAQIETSEAVDNAGAICAVEGVDMIFFGPYDLSASLGHLGQPDHPTVQEAFRHVAACVKANGKRLSCLPTPETSARDLFQAGCDLVISGSDMSFLRESMRLDVLASRESAS
jgi:4-hydroxy-2-oxoheptanedioate aldolase